MTIFYSCDKNRKLEVSVNGTKTVLKDLNSNNEVKSVTIPVSLKQGYNTVQMGNDFRMGTGYRSFYSIQTITPSDI